MVSLDVLVNYAPLIMDSHYEMDNLDDHTTFSSSRWEALAAMDLTWFNQPDTEYYGEASIKSYASSRKNWRGVAVFEMTRWQPDQVASASSSGPDTTLVVLLLVPWLPLNFLSNIQIFNLKGMLCNQL